MGEGHIDKLQRSFFAYVTFSTIVGGLIVVGLGWFLSAKTLLANELIFGICGGLWIVLSLLIGLVVSVRVMQPLRALSQAILHVSPNEHLVAAPKLEDLKVGRELVTSLTRQVYDFASTTQPLTAEKNQPNTIIEQIPLPIIGIKENGDITLANKAAAQYLEQLGPIVGKNIYSLMELSFQSEQTLDVWIKDAETKSIASTNTWEKVQLTLPSGTHYLDLAAQFSKHSQSGTDILLTLFDHTTSYSKEDNSVSFVSLAVHELRTPLTILRGYIEAMGEEIEEMHPSAEVADFMNKMEASAENLTTFVSNILNVARIDQNQLSLKLTEVQWPQTLTQIVDNMRLRAKVRNLEIELAISEGLPTVAADNITVAEVVNNIIENAIKYSGEKSGKIIVSSHLTQDGMVETTIQDFGYGIPTSVLPNIFQRFSRNHRTRTVVSGTGLGLYLSKAIITAHGGHIWARSQEGQGSVFGFTLLPYSKLASEAKNGDNKEITRSAGGWIKNHSLYRR